MLLFAKDATLEQTYFRMKTWHTTSDWGKQSFIFNTVPQGKPDMVSPEMLNQDILTDVKDICNHMFKLQPQVATSYTDLFAKHKELVENFDNESDENDFNWLADIEPLPISTPINRVLTLLAQEQDERHNVVVQGPTHRATFQKGLFEMFSIIYTKPLGTIVAIRGQEDAQDTHKRKSKV